ncbi:MAG: hypothetical protein IPJ32_17675 [Sphingobacteriaceae bacterium]|nr:hypothetical protein [Sphingobacteriaceae bacterium]
MKNNLLTIAALVLLASCGNNESADSEKAIPTDSVATTADTNVVADDGDEVALPSSMRIASIFKRSGLKFIETNLNPLDNAKNYKTSYIKALNLGVYSADMAYCLLNKQYALSKNYLKGSKDIGGELGLNSAFEANNLAKRFENNMNLGKDDSLLSIISDLQLETDVVLEKGNQQHISTIIFAGAWVETLYSASQVYKSGEQAIIPAIIEQVSLVDNILAVLEKQKANDSSIPSLIESLTAIKTEFNNISALKDKDLDEVDYTKTTFNKDEINKLCEKIIATRTVIVKG